MSRIEARLRELDIELPALALPSITPMALFGAGQHTVYISGQLSQVPQIGIKGVVGADVDMEMAITAARLCGINVIATIKAACLGDLDRVDRILKIVGFVQAAPGFRDHDRVIDGCSTLMVEVFKDRGRHVRSAVGIDHLPMNYCVEVEAIVQLL